MTEKLVALGLAAVCVLIAWVCRWIVFHEKDCRQRYLKLFPFYDQYCQPSESIFVFIKFFGLAGHVLCAFGATMNVIAVCLPSAYSGLAPFASLGITVLVCRKTLRGLKLSQQEKFQA